MDGNLAAVMLDAVHLKKVADRLVNTRESRRFLRDLDGGFAELLAGSPTGTSRSSRLAPDRPTMANGKPWIGPQVASLSVNERDGREKAVQRAFFCHGEVTVGARRLELLDMEFDTRPGTNGVDLLAMPEDAPAVRCIVELKYADSRSLGDSPVKAMVQALAYATDARAHEDVLNLQQRHDVSRRDVPRFPRGWVAALLVAANERYWREWRRRLQGEFSRLPDLAARIGALLVPGAWVHWAAFPDLPPTDRAAHRSGVYLPRVRCDACRWHEPLFT